MSAIILLDTSISMDMAVAGRRRIDVLSDILKVIMPGVPTARLFAFDSVVRELDGTTLPLLGGGTALGEALKFIASMRPTQVVVISDGEPDNMEEALDAGRALNCQIATYFCGDETNHAAVAFLRSLAWCSGDGLGRTAVADLGNPAKLTVDLRLALAGPG